MWRSATDAGLVVPEEPAEYILRLVDETLAVISSVLVASAEQLAHLIAERSWELVAQKVGYAGYDRLDLINAKPSLLLELFDEIVHSDSSS